jgi:hypothetical protein
MPNWGVNRFKLPTLATLCAGLNLLSAMRLQSLTVSMFPGKGLPPLGIPAKANGLHYRGAHPPVTPSLARADSVSCALYRQACCLTIDAAITYQKRAQNSRFRTLRKSSCGGNPISGPQSVAKTSQRRRTTLPGRNRAPGLFSPKGASSDAVKRISVAVTQFIIAELLTPIHFIKVGRMQ